MFESKMALWHKVMLEIYKFYIFIVSFSCTVYRVAIQAGPVFVLLFLGLISTKFEMQQRVTAFPFRDVRQFLQHHLIYFTSGMSW